PEAVRVVPPGAHADRESRARPRGPVEEGTARRDQPLQREPRPHDPDVPGRGEAAARASRNPTRRDLRRGDRPRAPAHQAAGDGLRFQNRRLNYVEARNPDLAVHTRKPEILDGEIVVMNGPLPSFEKLQERERASGKIKIEYLAKTLPATYIVFDVLYVGDTSVMGLSQMERKAILPDLVEVDDRVVLSDYIEGRGVDYFNAVIARGL